MRRREFITLVSSAAAWPLAARAQQPAMSVIGRLGAESREVENSTVVSFQQGLKEAGYIDGQNLAIEYRWAEGQYDRLPALAADLVRRQVSVIAAAGNAAALAAKAATTTVPIVFHVGDDPVQLGLVASLNRPGGNATGTTSLNVEVGRKRLELLRELVPNVAVIGMLVNPDNPNVEIQSREAQVAARKLGLELHIMHARAERDFDAAFATLAKLRAGALMTGDTIFFNHSRQLGALALRYAVPAISPFRDFAAGGGLMSYGTNIADMHRQVGIYTGRILKGEKPAYLPVQQAVKVDLVLNFKTAKTLGITVPLPLSGRADEVIE